MTLFKKVWVNDAATGRVEASGKIYQGRNPPTESQGDKGSPSLWKLLLREQSERRSIQF